MATTRRDDERLKLGRCENCKSVFQVAAHRPHSADKALDDYYKVWPSRDCGAWPCMKALGNPLAVAEAR